ncbi:hypothetical protein I6F35_18080 [Bradyrhizobium sp. BRP22]|uniref:hypothetical protein n=1 Tax=Bradyrhizobium sp. BRP22 TaxID=2793821 RepID=UPI001CD46D73|nr:hypothetical protein [Bradyrhizobium sp. BRP22]MCA1455118.1 hypothetical protein [Bradyrhizobium sp. BRP22]
MSGSVPVVVENAVQIAGNFLERSGEITDGYEAGQFLVMTRGKMLAGERRQLMLANQAINAYRKSKPEVA